ncbi:MAG: hypothetical protein FWD94_07940, partial [Treponema sp.]|nr:hypothetical protein [Treponema sp.]
MSGSPESPNDGLSANRLSFAFRPGLAYFKGVVAIVLIAIAVLVVLTFLFSKDPGRTLWFFFAGPFLNVFSFG